MATRTSTIFRHPPDFNQQLLPMRLVLFQPDIPQNTGTILRLAACFALDVDIIEPCGFVWSDRHLRRAGLDYLDHARVTRHASWPAFTSTRRDRLVLLTTGAETMYTEYRFAADDALIVGQESAGVPTFVHDAADTRLRIPMAAGCRSLNVAVAAALVVGEALRQTDRWPRPQKAESTA